MQYFWAHSAKNFAKSAQRRTTPVCCGCSGVSFLLCILLIFARAAVARLWYLLLPSEVCHGGHGQALGGNSHCAFARRLVAWRFLVLVQCLKFSRAGEGLILTVDTKSGITYRGYCVETEDNMNIKMTSVVATEADGSQRSIDHVFIRGSQVNFICFPDILAHAPMFDRVAQRKNGVIVERGLGRARQAALDAKGTCVLPYFAVLNLNC